MKKSFIVGGVIIILIAGIIIFQFSKQSPRPQFIEGEETLEVQILDANNNPIPNVEVDLWTLEDQNGPPSAGYKTTNSEGKVTFKIPQGDYLIGFNGYKFPEEFIFPEKISVYVEKGENQKTIILELK